MSRGLVDAAAESPCGNRVIAGGADRLLGMSTHSTPHSRQPVRADRLRNDRLVSHLLIAAGTTAIVVATLATLIHPVTGR